MWTARKTSTYPTTFLVQKSVSFRNKNEKTYSSQIGKTKTPDLWADPIIKAIWAIDSIRPVAQNHTTPTRATCRLASSRKIYPISISIRALALMAIIATGKDPIEAIIMPNQNIAQVTSIREELTTRLHWRTSQIYIWIITFLANFLLINNKRICRRIWAVTMKSCMMTATPT